MKKSWAILGLGLALSSFAALADNPPKKRREKTYFPRLGEIMNGEVQSRHLKIWLAGHNANWQLTAYEIRELKETVEDIERYQPIWRGRPIAKMMEKTMNPPLQALEKAVDKKDSAAFEKAYRDFTASCNSCHESVHYAFIAVDIPSGNPFSNQKFDSE